MIFICKWPRFVTRNTIWNDSTNILSKIPGLWKNAAEPVSKEVISDFAEETDQAAVLWGSFIHGIRNSLRLDVTEMS